MSTYIQFEIVTPERVVLKESIRQVSVPTKEGEITVLPGHIPLIASLMAGVLDVVKEDGEREIMSVSGGFIEVSRDKVVVMADTAERGHEIDLDRAEEARKRAEDTVKNAARFDREQYTEMSALIAKELARTSAAKRWRKLKNIE